MKLGFFLNSFLFCWDKVYIYLLSFSVFLLFPNHSTGVPALRKLVPPGILTRWLNGNWITDTANTNGIVPC